MTGWEGPAAETLLRPALEAAVAVAREGEGEEPAVLAPTPMRPLLRFAKLPRRALTVTRRALETDDEFRGRVARAVTESDVGRAGWLYLARPQGWEEELTGMVTEVDASARDRAERQADQAARRRLAAAVEAVRRAEEMAEEAREQAADAGAALAGERRMRQAAVEAAAEAEQRAAAVAAERDRARADAAAAQAEVEALRRRIAELERQRPPAAGPTPPAAPAGAPAAAGAMEDAAAAAAALAATLRVAAEALARPAAEPAPPPRVPPPAAGPPPPPRARRRPTPLPPAVYDDSREAATHLLRVPSMVLVVDGYNVSQAGWPVLPIAEQRRRLVDALTALAARTGADARVVFDGADVSMPGVVPTTAKAVKVSFSPPGVEADDVVVDLVSSLPRQRPVTVASSDRRVRQAARHAGANVISSSQLLSLLGR